MRKVIFVVLLLIGVAAISSAGIGYWMGLNSQTPDEQAQPQEVSDDLQEILASDAPALTLPDMALADPEETTNTTEPSPEGDRVEIVCEDPVELTILLSSAESETEVTAEIDIRHSPEYWYPEKNRLEIYVSKKTGLPCVDSSKPVRVLGHKQDQFCFLVREAINEACAYGVSLGDLLFVKLRDGARLQYRVVPPIPSDVATPLGEVYGDFYEGNGEEPTPAVMFDKFDYDVYDKFYEEAFLREGAEDELWLFTSCGRKVNGHSQSSCAVRTEFAQYHPAPSEVFER